METLEISKITAEKEVQTKFGLKKKQSCQFVEYGDIWHSVWTSGLKVGQKLTGTRESRDYQGKTYWDFKLPKKEDKVNMVDEKMDKVLNDLTTIKLALQVIKEAVIPKVQGRVQTEVEYPEEELGDMPF